MIRREPKTWSLNEDDKLWVRPGEELRASITFEDDELEIKFDHTGGTYVLDIKERPYTFKPQTYDEIDPVSFVETDPEFDLADVADGNVAFTLSKDTIALWSGRTLECILSATLDGKTWTAADFTIYVGQGE
jgi:hypothetical protein